MHDSPPNPCFTCQHRADSKRRVENWLATGATRGPVLDPAPHAECKDHPGYGVTPEASRPACEDWRAAESADEEPRPDPEGCGRCGRTDCRRPALQAQLDSMAVDTIEAAGERLRVEEEHRAARALCESRPRIDWQREARRWRNEASPPEPLATATTVIHADAGDGPWVELHRIAVPRGVPGRRARIVVLPDGDA